MSKSHSLLYIECTGTDGNCTGTDDTGMMVLALVLKVLTALALMLMTILSDSEVICNFKKSTH